MYCLILNFVHQNYKAFFMTTLCIALGVKSETRYDITYKLIRINIDCGYVKWNFAKILI